MLDGSKPLRRVVPVRVGSSSTTLCAELKFERVPDFCFVCGCIGHLASECLDPKAEDMIESDNFHYSSHLRAPNFSGGGDWKAGKGIRGVKKAFVGGESSGGASASERWRGHQRSVVVREFRKEAEDQDLSPQNLCGNPDRSQRLHSWEKHSNRCLIKLNMEVVKVNSVYIPAIVWDQH